MLLSVPEFARLRRDMAPMSATGWSTGERRSPPNGQLVYDRGQCRENQKTHEYRTTQDDFLKDFPSLHIVS
ncbi:uncharacterized protein PG998_004547 [Apiospora kogelbergensis]|uniref:uncharacterized protein n=1 Tax=Apiospora kogelbergensis TaxID=1337665 RepID=UPI00312F49B7